MDVICGVVLVEWKPDLDDQLASSVLCKVIWTVKTVSEMTYNVLSASLCLYSLTHPVTSVAWLHKSRQGTTTDTAAENACICRSSQRGQDSENAGHVSSMQLMHNSWNHMEGQGNKCRSTKLDWTEATTRHRRRKGHLTAQWIGLQQIIGKEEANQKRRLGNQHFLTICKQGVSCSVVEMTATTMYAGAARTGRTNS